MEHLRDLQKPTINLLQLIKWIPNELSTSETNLKRMSIIELIACKWETVGRLLNVGHQEIKRITHPGSSKTLVQCLCELLDKHWTENRSDEYPRTWQGLHTLLVDLELSEIANKLKEALNSQCNSVRGTLLGGHPTNHHESNPSDETGTSTSPSLSGIPLLSQQEQTKVLDACLANIHELLDVDEVTPLLAEENLLSEDTVLTVTRASNKDKKISIILAILRNPEHHDVLQKFVKSLRKSQTSSNVKLASIIEGHVFGISNTRKTNTGFSLCSWLLMGPLALMILLLLIYVFIYHPGTFGFLYHSKNLSYTSKVFVGREAEMEDLSRLLDFSHSESDIRIVNIVGSPGFGKSTLAIHLGNRLVREGIDVHYVNLADYQDPKIQQTLAEKILKIADESIKTPNFDQLLKWARKRFWNTLIIVDNCDDIIQTQKDSFFYAIVQLVEQSRQLKVVVTSREVTTQIDYFKRYPVFELNTRSACELLNKKLPSGANLTSSEVEEVAKLTGNTPLALQIIGALFSLPNPPNPSEVINNLQNHPIPQLSREELPTKHKINVSIDLSYRYLTRQMQMIGCFLANFPGSFTKEAAIHISMAHKEAFSMSYDHLTFNPPEENITVTLNSLIHRSLIEYDLRTERYQFHRLIREFFRDVQSRDIVLDLEQFNDNFNIFYSQKLTSCSYTFTTDYKQALADFHTERHNFQKLLESLVTSRLYSVHSFLLIFKSIVISSNTGLLEAVFTDQELVYPLRSALNDFDSIINYLQSNEWKQNKLIFSYEEIARTFIEIVYRLSGIEERLFGLETAIETCQKRMEIVDRFNISPTSIAAVSYSNFYEKLSKYYSAINNKTEAAYCYMKSLDLKTEKVISQCSMKIQCFFEYGKLLFNMGEKEKSAEYLENSYTNEQHSELDRLFLLFFLSSVFTYLNEQVKMDYYNSEFIKEVKVGAINMMDPYKLNKHSSDLLVVIRHVRDIGDADLATALEGELLEGIMEVKGHHSVPSTPEQTLAVLQYYYERGDYNKTHSLSLFILECLDRQHWKVPDKEADEIKVKTQLLMAKAAFHSGNYSQGMNEMEELLTFISGDQQLYVYKKELCLYLIPRLKFISTCYPWITSLPILFIKMLVKAVFTIPLDSYYNYYEHVNKDTHTLPKSQIPELEWQSTSTDLTLSDKHTLQQLLTSVPYSIIKQIYSTVQHFLKWWDGMISSSVGFVFQFTIIRFIFNVSTVFIRLYIVLFTTFLVLFTFNLAYNKFFRIFIIVRLYRLHFLYPEKLIFPSTIFLLNMLFFIDTVVTVLICTIMCYLYYLVTGINLFRLALRRGLIINGFLYDTLV